MRNPLTTTNGFARRTAKVVIEQVIWLRVSIQLRWQRLRQRTRPKPSLVAPTAVLARAEQWHTAVAECRRLGLPLHFDKPKNWDALGAVSQVLHEFGPEARVLDAGAARYSSPLPWLRLYGATDLIGNNLEFRRTRRHGPVRFEPGDITSTTYPDGRFDAVLCLSVIEHGVPLKPFLTETARILRPGGLLIISTDYAKRPPDTRGLTAYNAPVHVFSPNDIRSLVATAQECGLVTVGELEFDHELLLHWKRTGLDFTFIRLTFRRTRANTTVT